MLARLTRVSRHALLIAALCTVDAQAAPPKLVLQITVDQLRGDLLPRFKDRFGQGGFRLLMDRGQFFANAHYETANTVTCAGHAVLVTGADVGGHGIVANDWYDRELKHNVYCVDDPRYPVLGETAKAGAGMSPFRLTSTTVGDELVSAFAGSSRSYAIAGKDRSSIIPGGHRGKAFWISATGGMASSRYYYEALPAWVQQWNDRKPAQRYRDLGWSLAKPLDTYLNRASVANEFAHPKAGVGAAFPHPLHNTGDGDPVAAIRFSPYLDVLTAGFAQELIATEKLGHAATPDYLSISFSSNDYIGHAFGPNSVEAEDNLIRLDATLAGLFAFIDKAVGLQRTVIVLSADHGAGDIPEERRAASYIAERFGGDALKAKLNAGLRKRLNVDADLVTSLIPPNVYLDQTKVRELRLEPVAVENALAEELRAEPGIAHAFTRTDLAAGRIGNQPLLNSVQRAFHPKRSGDVVAIPEQFYYFDDAPDYYAATHGTPYNHDNFIPVILYVPGVKPLTTFEPVAPAQIAPTLSALLGIKAPSGCSCDPPLPHILSP